MTKSKKKKYLMMRWVRLEAAFWMPLRLTVSLSLCVSPFWSARLRFFCILSPRKRWWRHSDQMIPSLSLILLFLFSFFDLLCARRLCRHENSLFFFRKFGMKESGSLSTSDTDFFFFFFFFYRLFFVSILAFSSLSVCGGSSDSLPSTFSGCHRDSLPPNRLENLLVSVFLNHVYLQAPLLVTCRPIPIGHSTPPRLLRFFRKFLNGNPSGCRH